MYLYQTILLLIPQLTVAHLFFSQAHNITAPKYQTAYACEGKQLTIECDPGDLINLIRANYGRFSITICNDHGNVEWSVNCMSPKSLRVLNSRCAHKQSCSVLATTSMFGDPCTGTHKYLEAHYQCIPAAQTSTTTNRPSPPWVLTNTPPLLLNISGGVETSWSSTISPVAVTSSISPNRLKNHTTNKNNHRHEGPPPPPPIHHHHSPTGQSNTNGIVAPIDSQPPVTSSNGDIHLAGARPPSSESTSRSPANGLTNSNGAETPDPSKPTNNPNTRILTGVGGSGGDDSSVLIKNRNSFNQQHGGSTQSTVTRNISDNTGSQNASSTVNRNINNINNYNGGIGNDEEQNLFCGPATSRNLFWNITRIGEVNVQPCPGGATGIAKWRCVLIQRIIDSNDEIDSDDDCTANNCKTENSKQQMLSFRRNFQPSWHPMTPDLTQCRSLWLNNLEVRVNQRDSSLISIANDLSEVTSSKTLYGGDMLVTTKIIQTMSEKMFYDMETFPDQRQREAIIYELLHGVVKTGSNLLDESQLSSWLDLNLEDQMRVATSLLTGLEDNAFLLADTIIRERNVVQKVKNILLSVRVLETKNIQSNEIFPDLEQWQISDDRIELPRGALIENSEGGLVRIVFAAFDRLESILKPTYDHFELKNSRNFARNSVALSNDTQLNSNSQRVRILNSKVISASLGKGRHIQLSQPIKLVLRHLKTENVSNPTCVFWNYIDHAWSANGCNLESTNRTHSICMCNHLTNFAILMDLDENNHSLLSIFDSDMRILIYISISVCVIFVIIAILTLKLFNGVFVKVRRRRQQQQLHQQQQQQQQNQQIHNESNSNNHIYNVRNLQQQLQLQLRQHHQQQQQQLQQQQQQPQLQQQQQQHQLHPLQHQHRTNNINQSNFNQQQQQQQQQHQQQVVAAAAAVVVANNNRNLQMNNLNLNLNLNHNHRNHNNHNNINNNNNYNNHNNNNQVETPLMNNAAAAAVAAAAVAVASATNDQNLNTIAAALQGNNITNSNNHNNNNNNSNNINHHSNNIVQGNLEDLQYKWWWW